jgi:hypothetical protein
MAQQPRGSLLQMARMIPNSVSGKKTFEAWDSSSDESETESVQEPAPPLEFHTLSSAVSILTQSLKENERKNALLQQQASMAERMKIEADRILPKAPAGPDAEHTRTIFDLGFRAGLAQRPQEKPCETCRIRREKNRIAAAEQRERAKRQKLEEEEEN